MWKVDPSQFISAQDKASARLDATLQSVDAERDRRIAAGFTFGGKLYQARDSDIRNINGASTAAAVAIMNGSLSGDFRWSDPSKDFAWIASDNSMVQMDAQTVIAFGQTAMTWVTAMTMAGRTIKDRLIAGEPLTVTEDNLWPAPTS